MKSAFILALIGSLAWNFPMFFEQPNTSAAAASVMLDTIPKPAYKMYIGPSQARAYAYIPEKDSVWKIVHADSAVNWMVQVLDQTQKDLKSYDGTVTLLQSQLMQERNLTAFIRENGQVALPADEWQAKVRSYHEYLRREKRQ
jgi:hypothetical protein